MRAALARPARFEIRISAAWIFLLSTWAAGRLVFLVVGELADHSLGHVADPHAFSAPHTPGDEWAHYDGAFYVVLAGRGYAVGHSTYAFFPLYPLLIRAGSEIVAAPALWGLAISYAASLAATVFLYRLAEELHGERSAQATAIVFTFFPTAFFLGAVYTESLFVALAAGAVWALRVGRRPWLAALLAAGAGATRSLGVLLLVPLALDWWRLRRELPRRSALALPASLAGFGGYALYLLVSRGSPLLFVGVERTDWRRSLANPLDWIGTIAREAWSGSRWLFHPDALFGIASNAAPNALAATTSFGGFLVACALVALGVRRLPLGWWLYALGALAPAVLTVVPNVPLLSFSRLMICAFPLFVVAGDVLARSRSELAAWTTATAALGLYLTCLFTTGRWVA